MDIKIDQSAVIEAAAQKVADAVLADYGDLRDWVEKRIEEEISAMVSDDVRATVGQRIDTALDTALANVLEQKIIPVDIWGEGKGEPTTIREQLHARALNYWEERVEPDKNNRGHYRPRTYGGEPRHRLVFKDVAEEAFRKAMAANVSEMVAAFRDAMKRDAAKTIAAHIENIINNRVVESTRKG